MSIDYKLIGTRIQSMRKQKGLTQETLAERLDVSVGYVSQVERGITKISLDLLAAIATVLECEISQFVIGSSMGEGYLESEISEQFRLLDRKEKRLIIDFINLILKNREQ